MDKKLLNLQSQHWESNFSSKPEMFGFEPSYSAKKALETFKKNNITNIIELGAGLGRDTIFFAQNGIYVHAIDYSLSAINIIKKRSKENNLDALIKVENHDIRKKLDCDNENFQACYSHMLFCMALTNQDLKDLNQEIFRVLKKDGTIAFEVGEIRNGKIKLEDAVIPIAEKKGFVIDEIMINQQRFTKTSNIWGVSNNQRGTNTNRIVLMRK